MRAGTWVSDAAGLVCWAPAETSAKHPTQPETAQRLPLPSGDEAKAARREPAPELAHELVWQSLQDQYHALVSSLKAQNAS